MKKLKIFNNLIIIVLLFLSLGCNNNREKAQVQNESENINENIQYFPASKFFKIDTIVKAEFIEKGVFEMIIDIKNISTNTFSRFNLSAEIQFIMKNSEEPCISTIQYNDIEPEIINNWEPDEIKRVSFTSLTAGQLAYYSGRNITYERTPESITLLLGVSAISVDEEINGNLDVFDLLPNWKLRQVEEGLR